MTQLTISQARNRLTALPKELAKTPEHSVCVTVHGHPELAVMSWELYESLLETIEVMSEPRLVEALRASVEDIEHGRLLSHEEVGRRLGL